MTELHELAELLKETNKDSFLNDSVGKIIVGLCTAGIIGGLVFANAMNANYIRMETNQVNILRRMDSVEEFMKAPRFTATDFEQKVKPFTEIILRHDAELNSRSSRIRELEYKSNQNTRELELLKDTLSEIKLLLKKGE